jgi:hypothetical protein
MALDHGRAERHSATQRSPRSHSSASLRSRSASALTFAAGASLRYRTARALLMASQIPGVGSRSGFGNVYDRLGELVGVPRAFGMFVCHSPSAILCLPAFVSRSSPGNSSMYPSWISRSLCSGGIVRCIGPLAQLRSDTNSSWVSGGADKPCAIPRTYASNCPFSS